MSSPLDRRKFLERAAVAGVALAARRRGWLTIQPAPKPLRIAVIASRRSADRALGLALGLDEARHAAQLFGGSVEMRTAPGNERLEAAANRLLADAPAILIGGDSAAECSRLAELVTRHSGALYFNVGCQDDALRGAECQRAAYHICPSAAMLRDAVLQSGAAGAGGVAAAWDAALVKFGADTLNERFHKQFGRAMTSEVWTAWVAVKIAWEASLRARSTDARAIAAFLDSPAAQFDGHKGRALSFRSWNHQLRQPVYVVPRQAAATREPIEVPASRAEEDVRVALDRLGMSRTHAACNFSRSHG